MGGGFYLERKGGFAELSCKGSCHGRAVSLALCPLKVPKSYCSRKVSWILERKLVGADIQSHDSCSLVSALNVQSNCHNQREGALCHKPQGPAVYRVRQQTALTGKKPRGSICHRQVIYKLVPVKFLLLENNKKREALRCTLCC